MRQSRRTEILDAALRVIAQSGVTAVTFESVAEESGLTKGGLLYHFPSREALIHAVNEHLASALEAAIDADAARAAGTRTVGKDRSLSDSERLAAYVRVGSQAASRADLLLFLETVNNPALHKPWRDVLERWAPPVDESEELSPEDLDRVVARLAADGLWLYESLTDADMSPRVRDQIAEHLSNMVLGNT